MKIDKSFFLLQKSGSLSLDYDDNNRITNFMNGHHYHHHQSHPLSYYMID